MKHCMTLNPAGHKESGAQGEIRTRTPVKAEDFESPASTVPPLGPLRAV